MALDWGKNISFTGLRKKAGKAKVEYPSKTYMNLAVQDAKSIDIRRTLLTGILLIAVVAAFAKFGVFDILDNVNKKSGELSQRAMVLSNLESQLVDYDAVLEEYNLYESARMVSNAGDVPAVDVLALVDDYISPSAQVSSINLQGNTLALNLSGVSLDSTGSLVSTLYQQPIVGNVRVATASNNDAGEDNNTVAMTITLQAPKEVGGLPADGAAASQAAAQS